MSWAWALLLPLLGRGSPGTFEEFVSAFNRTYSSPEEREYRRKVFEGTKAFVEEANHKLMGEIEAKFAESANATAARQPFGINLFADLDYAEFRENFLMKNVTIRDEPHKMQRKSRLLENARIKKSVNWAKKYPILLSILYQGSCGGCWAFAAISLLNAWVSARHRISVEFSVQEPIACAKEAVGCKGGEPSDFIKYVMDYGVSFAYQTPFPSSARCRNNRQPLRNRIAVKNPDMMLKIQRQLHRQAGLRAHTVMSAMQAPQLFVPSGRLAGFEGYRRLLPGMTNLLQESSRHPVAAVMGSSEHLKNYSRDVFGGEGCSENDDPSHAVLIVGHYLVAPDEYVLRIMNSWGEGWGERGYFRMDAGPLDGIGPCNIAHSKANIILIA